MEAKKLDQKIAVSLIGPSDFDDVWALFKEYFSEKPWPHPNLQGQTDEEILVALYRHCSSPQSFGFIFRLDGVACGQMLCQVVERQFGLPRQYVYVFNLYVRPEHRRLGVASLLWKAVVDKMKSCGLTHWEAGTHDEFEDVLTSTKELNASRLYSVVGGTI